MVGIKFILYQLKYFKQYKILLFVITTTVYNFGRLLFHKFWRYVGFIEQL